MKLTLEELERKAYIEGNVKLANFLAILIGNEYPQEIDIFEIDITSYDTFEAF